MNKQTPQLFTLKSSIIEMENLSDMNELKRHRNNIESNDLITENHFIERNSSLFSLREVSKNSLRIK